VKIAGGDIDIIVACGKQVKDAMELVEVVGLNPLNLWTVGPNMTEVFGNLRVVSLSHPSFYLRTFCQVGYILIVRLQRLSVTKNLLKKLKL
jgi:hypothetical protein